RGAFEKLIDQNRPVRREANCRANVFIQTLFVVNDRHRASAEHITRTNQYWVADLLRNLLRLVTGRGHTVFRLRYSKLREQRAKSFAILGEVNRVSRG